MANVRLAKLNLQTNDFSSHIFFIQNGVVAAIREKVVTYTDATKQRNFKPLFPYPAIFTTLVTLILIAHYIIK
jgi:hypothetical protein